jgi:hypothetical protein
MNLDPNATIGSGQLLVQEGATKRARWLEDSEWGLQDVGLQVSIDQS